MTGTRQAFGRLAGSCPMQIMRDGDYERRNDMKVSVGIVAVILHFCLRL